VLAPAAMRTLDSLHQPPRGDSPPACLRPGDWWSCWPKAGKLQCARRAKSCPWPLRSLLKK